MKPISRRKLIQYGISSGSLFLVPQFLSRGVRAQTQAEPHFFFQIFLGGGADGSYLFDGRPLSMTAAGKMQNYIGKEPNLWTGSNGGRCWATELTAPFVALKDYISILNGVMMEPTFPGHDQNTNSYLCGNPFGGESFIPHLNQNSNLETTPLDAVQTNGFFFSASPTNGSSTVAIDSQASDSLQGLLSTVPVLTPGDDTYDFTMSRLQENAVGTGRFSQGSQLLADGLVGSSNLHRRVSALPPGDPKLSPDLKFAELACRYFREGLSRSAFWSPDRIFFDTHAPSQAKQQPASFLTIATQIAGMIEYLRKTEFDKTRSMLDVTTVVVTTEFTRTMRQLGLPIDATGSDHNTLTNTVLVAGHGIKGGQVIGESDFRSENEILSGAHAAMDPRGIQLMARPFDFLTMKPRADLPSSFDLADYLTIHSVVNTFYSMFAIPESMHRILGRGRPVAPVLSTLLKS